MFALRVNLVGLPDASRYSYIGVVHRHPHRYRLLCSEIRCFISRYPAVTLHARQHT